MNTDHPALSARLDTLPSAAVSVMTHACVYLREHVDGCASDDHALIATDDEQLVEDCGRAMPGGAFAIVDLAFLRAKALELFGDYASLPERVRPGVIPFLLIVDGRGHSGELSRAADPLPA